MTAHAFEGERQKALAAGMDDYVTKPISASILSEVIQRWWPKAHSDPESGERLASIKVEAAPLAADTAALALDPNVRRSDAVARVFLKYVPDQIVSIGQAVEAGDVATLNAAAHKLKGSCLAVGVPRMAELCAALEEGGGDAKALFLELCAVFEPVERELSAQLASKPTSAAS